MSEIENGITVRVTHPYDSERMAKHMIHTLLGHENEYLERLMFRQLNGMRDRDLHGLILPSTEIDKLKQINANLEMFMAHHQNTAVSRLSTKCLDSEKLDEETIKKSNALVMETVLAEKVHDRINAINENRWKRINAVLIPVLSIITSLVTYFITNSQCSHGSS